LYDSLKFDDYDDEDEKGVELPFCFAGSRNIFIQHEDISEKVKYGVNNISMNLCTYIKS